MNQGDSNSGNIGVVRTPGDWDMETIIAQIRRDLNGTASRSEIRSVLAEIAPRYDGVRITTFVPIFLRKDVCRRLQSGPRHYQAVGASGTSGTSGKDADTVREDATATPQSTDEPAPTEESTEERTREPANG